MANLPSRLPAKHRRSGAEHAAHSPEEIRTERLLTLVSVLIALTGIGIGWVMFNRKPLRQMPRLLENKYYVDEVYDAAVIKPIHVVSREGLWKIFDVGVIDGFLHTLGSSVVDLGRTFRYMQFGFLRGYAAIILAGALIIIGYFAYQGAQMLTEMSLECADLAALWFAMRAYGKQIHGKRRSRKVAHTP